MKSLFSQRQGGKDFTDITQSIKGTIQYAIVSDSLRDNSKDNKKVVSSL